MKTLVVGLGIQGNKRKITLGENFFAAVDPQNPDADYSKLTDVPPQSFQAVICCLPDPLKLEVVDYCYKFSKHLLIEKPLISQNLTELQQIEENYKSKGIYIQSAYNHRFEPNIIKIKEVLENKILGEIYTVRLFYGNGTSQLIKESAWKNSYRGVGVDLGSHILDLLYYWFGDFDFENFTLKHNFETECYDYFSFIAKTQNNFLISAQTSYLSWKNSFQAEITGSLGTVVMNSFCKWSESNLEIQTRVFPSGKPTSNFYIEPYGDLSWEKEHQDFFTKIKNKTSANLTRDFFIQESLKKLNLLEEI